MILGRPDGRRRTRRPGWRRYWSLPWSEWRPAVKFLNMSRSWRPPSQLVYSAAPDNIGDDYLEKIACYFLKPSVFKFARSLPITSIAVPAALRPERALTKDPNIYSDSPGDFLARRITSRWRCSGLDKIMAIAWPISGLYYQWIKSYAGRTRTSRMRGYSAPKSCATIRMTRPEMR